MKNRQIIALISSIFFFNLLVFSLPTKGQIYKRTYQTKYGIRRNFYEKQECLSKNLKTIEISEGPTGGLYCIISRIFNKHGIIYKVHIETGALNIYVGNKLDVIVEYPNTERIHGNVDQDDYFDQRVPVFLITFPGRRGDSIRIPKY